MANSDHRRRFVETALPLHAPLYVVGQARERADVIAPEIAASQEAAMFLISTRSEERVQKGFAIGSWVCWACGLLIAPGFLLIGLSQTPELHGSPLLVTYPAAALAAYLLLGGLSWVGMAYNSLVGLRQRVRQGWSLIDVQLKRRHDLIPNLAAAVNGLSRHERETQAALRARTGAGEICGIGACRTCQKQQYLRPKILWRWRGSASTGSLSSARRCENRIPLWIFRRLAAD